MESVFQFKEPSLLRLEFKINEEFENTGGEDVKIKLKVETRVNKNENASQAFVVLCVTVGEETGKMPFYVYAEEAAWFKWQNEINEEAVGRLLEQNAPALLLSYLRPIIASITGSSSYSAYNMPFINFKGNK